MVSFLFVRRTKDVKDYACVLAKELLRFLRRYAARRRMVGATIPIAIPPPVKSNKSQRMGVCSLAG